jgi:hypothetical protein
LPRVGTTEDDALKAEWARARAAGRGVSRKKAFATLVSVAVTFVTVVAGYIVFYLAWPFDRVPVLFLALPWLPALPLGWFVRRKLWPGGALAS